MSAEDVLLAFVGKPSAGKSSFLNAVTDATAKVGNFPFTTIRPNHGVAYVPVECPCVRFGKSDQCQPRYGKCVEGQRMVPIKIIDVAGLVPGASEGQGLGNQFLDDLRTADALIHVVDVSGTTDAGGKETVGYDPINDIDWLRGEIHSWIKNNLMKRWPNIVRRHVAVKSTAAETLQLQFSGYGSTLALVQQVMDVLAARGDPVVKEPMETWTDETVHRVVDAFLDERFPTVVALNKIDLPDADKNIDRICRKYDASKIVLTSALSESFLRKLHKQKFIKYYEGTDRFELAEDQTDAHPEEKLKPLDERTKSRLEKVQDLVLFRYGTTGVLDAVRRAIELLGLVPAFPVKNINNFTSGTGTRTSGVFRDCILLKPGTTVRQFAKIVHPELERYYLYAETIGNRRLGEDDIVTKNNNVISFRTSQTISKLSASNAGTK
ncbi:P-loop containing nucleoside triphosphate hydrolase protein [Cladochytrium replicatum]|nr:P-loop containing nucleoside triphosphate hydrolase protein [Cladochytrium replicatum]